MSSTAQGGSMPRFSVGDEIELRVRVVGYSGSRVLAPYETEVIGARGPFLHVREEALLAGKRVHVAFEAGDMVSVDLNRLPSIVRATINNEYTFDNGCLTCTVIVVDGDRAWVRTSSGKRFVLPVSAVVERVPT